MKTFLILMSFTLAVAHAAEEPQVFLKRCFRKEYSEKQKTTKALTFAIYENLAGETFGTLEVQFKTGYNPTAGISKMNCEVDKEKPENLHCKSADASGKISFVQNGNEGVIKIEDTVELKVHNSYTPGTSISRLPANSEVKVESNVANACDKLD